MIGSGLPTRPLIDRRKKTRARRGFSAADFMIDGPRQHGRERLIHMFGIESPGLTSALSLAEEVTSYLSS